MLLLPNLEKNQLTNKSKNLSIHSRIFVIVSAYEDLRRNGNGMNGKLIKIGLDTFSDVDGVTNRTPLLFRKVQGAIVIAMIRNRNGSVSVSMHFF